MNNAIENLRPLIADGTYVVDEKAVADAMIARARARESVARVGFQSRLKASPERSLRRRQPARSLRLERMASPKPHLD